MALVLGCGALSAHAHAEPVHPKIHPSVEFHDDGLAEVIVCVLDPDGRAAPDCIDLQAVLATLPPERVKLWDCPDSIVVTLTEPEALLVAADPLVHSIVPNLVLHTALYDSVEIVDAVGAWEIQAAGYGLTGHGQTIAIVDTGVKATHPDLAGRNVFPCDRDCTTGLDCPENCLSIDLIGHGTHVTGCAAASGGIDGIAPGANYVSLKVFAPGTSSAETLFMKRAVRWAVDHAEEYGICVISMSIASTEQFAGQCPGIYNPLQTAVQDAVAAGVAVVAASGNHGLDSASFPACIPGVIAVGATTKQGSMGSFSNHGEIVHLFSPGLSILSTCISDSHCVKSGTSMATPMVSGAIAVVRQVLDTLGVQMHPADIAGVLFDTGDPILDRPFETNRRINVAAAVRAIIEEHASPADLNIDGVVDGEDLELLLEQWGECTGPCSGDIANEDGVVDALDLLLLLAQWSA